MEDIWDSSAEGRGGWNPGFSKPFNNWEVDVVESFLEWLHGKEFVEMWKAWCLGLKQRVTSFLSNHSTTP